MSEDSIMLGVPKHTGDPRALVAGGPPYPGSLLLSRQWVPWARERLAKLDGWDEHTLAQAAQLEAALEIAQARGAGE